MLGGAIQAANGIGLELVAGNGDILVQAQSDTLTVASQKDMTIAAGQAIDFAAAKKIVIKTAAGACIEISSSGINVTAPGSFTVHAASHQFVSGGGQHYSLSAFSKHPADFDEEYVLRWPYDNTPVKNRKFEVLRQHGGKIRGQTDAEGKTGLQQGVFAEGVQLKILPED